MQPFEEPMTAQLAPPEALIYAMITTSAVDRRISDDELSRIGSIVKELPPFHEFDRDWLVNEAQDCGKILAKPEGLDKVLDLIAEGLPERLHETAYVLAAEVAATDLRVKLEEVRFLELLADRLKLDKLVCAALERAARARHQKA
jgi:uncharacterized membrane protein YebE (DUF533 family)